MPEKKDQIQQTIELSKTIEGVKLPDVIKALTGYEVFQFNENDSDDKIIFQKICETADNFINYTERTEQRFRGNRSNDVGKRIENVFVEELKKSKITPLLLGSSGYPDIKLIDEKGKVTYLESKAVSKGWNSNFRSFYLSPGINIQRKIDSDAHHLLIAWFIEEESPKYWKVTHWKLCNLYNLSLKLKLEFNSNNDNLYSETCVIKDSD